MYLLYGFYIGEKKMVYNIVDYGSFSFQSDTGMVYMSGSDTVRLFFFYIVMLYSSKVNTSIVQEFDCLTLVHND